ncbi:polyphenol oxidase family protein [Comamonadaceae bacterium SL12-8]|uniref:Polyphenol oxidase family protein n=2 Tax=Amphibiibacter pelophylacis TaxID=1799477 RepID=A0ACC6P319_9BURK
MSTRAGGVSTGDFAGLNLRPVHYGPTTRADEADCIARNQALWQTAVAAPVRYLHQVHGTRVVRWTGQEPVPAFDAPLDSRPQADAAITTAPGVVCTVLVADCLPVLLWAVDAGGRVRGVGAAHAGWRGLAGGVLEETVAALKNALEEEARLLSAPSLFALSWHAWLGACIGPQAFEVGPEVREAFLASAPGGDAGACAASCFVPQADRPGHFLADLPELARQRLRAAGVAQVSGGDRCTYGDAARFFSYRRDAGVTGRMAASICFALRTDPP